MRLGGEVDTRVEIAPQPAREEDQKITVALKDPAVLTAAGSVVSGVLAAGSGTGPLAYALAAVLVLAAVAAVIMLARRDRV
jgi:lysozyme family protein